MPGLGICGKDRAHAKPRLAAHDWDAPPIWSAAKEGANRWERRDGALVYLSDGLGGKLAAPVVVRARHYEIEVGFARLSGKGRLHVDLPLGDGKPTIVPVYVDAEGSKLTKNRTGAVWPAGKPTSGTVVIHIERNADDGQDHIALRFDGGVFLEWSGRLADVDQVGEPHPGVPGQPVTSLWASEASYAISKWILRVFDGEARVVPRASAAVTPAPAASAPPTAAAAVPPAAQAAFAVLLEDVATDLLAQRSDEALRRWQAGRDAADLKPLAGQVAATGKLVEAAARLPQRLADSLRADVGKTVAVELRSGKGEFEIREVAGTTVKTMVKVERGKVSRAFSLADLGPAEKLRRLGEYDTPELLLLRGLVTAEAGRAENAAKLFAQTGEPLGEALAAQIDSRRKTAKPAPPEKQPEKQLEPQWEDLLADPGLGAWTCEPGTWKVRGGVLGNETGPREEMWTRKAYSDYELQLEFKLEKGGNSGLLLNDNTKGVQGASYGLEVQIQDNATNPNQPNQRTGGVFGRVVPRVEACRPPGEWNRMVVVCRGRHVTVELNGTRVVDEDVLTAEEVAGLRQKAGVADSALKPGQLPPGHIGLQKWTGVVWFRNIRIR